MLEGTCVARRDAGDVDLTLRYATRSDDVSGRIRVQYTYDPAGSRSPNAAIICRGGSPCKLPGGVSTLTSKMQLGSSAVNLTDLCRRNESWYTSGKLTPANSILRNIQIPRMNGMNVPGWVFMMDQPTKTCNSDFFEHALRIGLMRYQIDRDAFMRAPVRRRAIIAADSIQAVANHSIYITDFAIDAKGGREEIDWFSSLSRVISGGDCEDSAKEIIMLCTELQQCVWQRGTLVWAAADALRHYVASMALGSVRGAKLGDSTDGYLAHAYIILIPRPVFEGLIGDQFRVALPASESRLKSDERLYPLTLDGTNLKGVEEGPEMSIHPGLGGDAIKRAIRILAKRVDHAGDRFKSYTNTGSNFYIHIVSLLTCSVESVTYNTPVYQLYIEDGSKYGATFKEVCELRRGIRLVPTCIPTPDELQACRAALCLYPPIPPHAFNPEGQDRLLDHLHRFLNQGGQQWPYSSSKCLRLSASLKTYTERTQWGGGRSPATDPQV